MRTFLAMTCAASLMLCAAVALAGQPDEAKFPNLTRSWKALQEARGHLQRAEAAHVRTGTLGGHGGQAVAAVDAALGEIDQAIQFADSHRKPGAPGVVTPKPPLVSRPDDAKYPNLGEARLATAWALRHIEDAMQYHAPTGTLGGHGEKAVQHCRRALAEIGEAERWADTHR